LPNALGNESRNYHFTRLPLPVIIRGGFETDSIIIIEKRGFYGFYTKKRGGAAKHTVGGRPENRPPGNNVALFKKSRHSARPYETLEQHF
jgi:hypothetical protein